MGGERVRSNAPLHLTITCMQGMDKDFPTQSTWSLYLDVQKVATILAPLVSLCLLTRLIAQLREAIIIYWKFFSAT